MARFSILDSRFRFSRAFGIVPTVSARLLSTACWFVIASTSCSAGAESTAVRTSAVSDYSLQGSSNLPSAIPNSKCFQQGMTGQNYGCNNQWTPTPWTFGSNFTNSSVWDSDFIDPQVQSGGGDNAYFDVPGTAIGYFTGHGMDPGCNALEFCSSSAQCNAPNASKYQIGPGTCRSGPPGSFGAPPHGPVCCYNTDRAVVTSSGSSSFGNRAIYSQVWLGPSARWAAWGESTNSGSWSSAGTNGGVNLVVLDISHGVTPQYWVSQLRPAFAGLQYLATIMPTAGDTSINTERGRYFAQRWQANAAEPMANAWTYTLNDLPPTLGDPCKLTPPGGQPDYSLGGGHGINGCGCNFIISFDTQSRAYYKMAYGNWNTLRDDANDGISSGYHYWFAVCNYDTNTYPWAL